MSVFSVYLKLVFILKRLGENKFFAPLIHEALERGHVVELWLDYRDISQTTKWYEFPSEKELPRYHTNFAPICRPFIGDNELSRLGTESDANVVFSVGVIPYKKPEGQKWAHVITSLLDSPCSIPLKNFNEFDVIFFNSAHWIDEIIIFYQNTAPLDFTSEIEKELRHKAIITGTPQFDHFEFCDRKKTLQKAGLAPERKVVTVFAFELNMSFWCQRIFREHRRWMRLLHLIGMPFTYPGIFSRIGLSKLFGLAIRSLYERFSLIREALTCPSELEILEAIREFCDRNDCLLVLKARRKHNLSPHHIRLPDYIVEGDTEYFPATPNQWQFAGDLVITFYSTAAAEAAAGNRPVINLRPRKNTYFSRGLYNLILRDEARTWEITSVRYYQDPPESTYNFRELIRSWKVDDAIAWFRKTHLDELNFTDKTRRSYMERFIAPESGSSSGRILDFLENRLS